MRLALLILLLLPIAAHAVSVIPLVAAALGASTFVQLALAVAVAVYGNARQRRRAQNEKNAYNNGLKDRTATIVASDSPYRYVYGRARVGSDVVALLASGSRDEFKHIVSIHASHECDAFEEIYINGNPLGTLDANGYVTSGQYYKTSTIHADELITGGTSPYTLLNAGVISASVQVYVTATSPEFAGYDEHYLISSTYSGGVVSFTNPYAGNSSYTPPRVAYQYSVNTSTVRIQKHLGVAGDPVDAYLHGLLPTAWPTTSTLSGLCYTVITLDLNEPEFQTGLPSIEVLLRGKKLYDPRTATTYWSQNNALVIRDYLTSELCGVAAADIPDSMVIAAANDCDATITLASVNASGVVSSGPRFTFNGTVTSDQAQQDVLTSMADSMAGGISATTWNMWAGVYVAPILALAQEDIVGKIAITPGVSDADLFNGVKGQFSSSLNNYVTTDFTPYQNSAYVTADGGRELWHNMDFPFTDNVQRVWNLARIFAEDQRNSYTVTAEFSLKAWDVRAGDRVTLTSAVFGWSAKVFRVVDKKFSPTSPVELTLKEDVSTIWDQTDSSVPDATPNTNLPNPYAIAPLASLTVTSGNSDLLLQSDGTIVSRMHVTWPQATTQAVVNNGLIEVEWLMAGGGTTWNKAQVSGDVLGAYLSPALDTAIYTIRARTVNPYFNVKSDWLYTTHKVAGKSALPPDVTGFGVSETSDATRHFVWNTTDQPIDVTHGGGYIIKYRTGGTSTPWATMSYLHAGLITQSPFETSSPAAGTYDFAISSVDSSGNESTNATLVSGVVITDTSTASSALAAANAAQASANTANNEIANINSDSVLSKGEKPAVVVDFAEIINTQADIDAKADAFAQDRTAYDAAITTLKTYLTGLSPAYDDYTQDTPIPQANYADPLIWPTYYAGDNLRTRFNDVYLKRQKLLNAIAVETANRATWTGVVSSSGKLSTAGDIFNHGSVGSLDIAAGGVGTTNIANGAATDIILTTVSAVVLAADGGGNFATINYTAPIDCTVELTLSGYSATTTGGIGGGVTFIEAPNLYINYYIGGAGTNIAHIAPAATQTTSPSTPYDLSLSLSATLNLVAGTTYSFQAGLYTRSSAYHATITSADLRLTSVKK